MKKYILAILCTIISIGLLSGCSKAGSDSNLDSDIMHGLPQLASEPYVSVDYNEICDWYRVNGAEFSDISLYIIVDKDTKCQYIGVPCMTTYKYVQIVNSDGSAYTKEIENKDELLSRFTIKYYDYETIITDNYTGCQYIKIYNTNGSSNQLFTLRTNADGSPYIEK